MNMYEVKCRNCGAAISYVPGARHLKCDACGSEFVLQGDGNGGGLTQIMYGGGILFQAYIPEGWNYAIFEDADAVSRDAPKCFGFRAWSEEASLVFLLM